MRQVILVGCWLTIAGTMTVSCAQNECDRAADRATECGFDAPPTNSTSSSSTGAGAPTPATVRDCNAVASCQAACFNQAAAISCDAVKPPTPYADGGAPSQAYQDYVSCLAACH